jgi:putative hydrolase of the HAD superfamily
MEEIRDLILAYVRTRLELPVDEADALRRRYFQEYGTTMRGLQINHQIDADDYLRFVHDIPLQRYLEPNPDLDNVLSSIAQQKVVFTNASREHAEGVLDQLGVRRHFSRIVDVRDVEYESKPQPAAYQRACQLAGVPPAECLLVEDNVRNIMPAKALGMRTVLVGDGQHSGSENVDFCINRVEEIGQVVESLAE